MLICFSFSRFLKVFTLKIKKIHIFLIQKESLSVQKEKQQKPNEIKLKLERNYSQSSLKSSYNSFKASQFFSPLTRAIYSNVQPYQFKVEWKLPKTCNRLLKKLVTTLQGRTMCFPSSECLNKFSMPLKGQN